MHVACFVKTLIVTLSKKIDKNKLLTLSTETYMHVVQVLLKHFLLLYFKKLTRTNKLLSLSTKTKVIKIGILCRIMRGEWNCGM